MLGVVGDPPPPEVEWTDADEGQVRMVPTGVVTLAAGGELWFDGAPLGQGADALAELLREPGPTPGTTSPQHVIVRADRNAAWSRVTEILVACASPPAGVARIHFAAQPEDGGAVGTVALFLAYERGTEGDDLLDDFDHVVAVGLRDEGESLDPTVLYHALLPIARVARCGVDIYAEGGATVGEVLALADAALRAGAARIDFWREGPIADASSRIHGRLVLRPAWGTPELGSGTSPMPPRTRASGIVGITDFEPVHEPPELEYDDPPDVDAPGAQGD